MAGFLENLKGTFAAPADPNAMNPTYGVPEGDVYNADMASLQRMATLFMAAGQSMPGKDRAAIIAQIADNDPSKSIYNMAQARLMNTNAQEAADTRSRRQKALAALNDPDKQAELIGSLTGREAAIYRAYLEAGDAEGALGFLKSVSDNMNTQALTLSDGSQISRGAYNTNLQNWNKAYGPRIESLDENVNTASQILDLLDEGFLAGVGSNAVLYAEKLKAMAPGAEIDPKALNTEKGRAAALGLVVNRMKDLGGNDSYQELTTLLNMFAGDNLEEGTIRANINRFLKSNIRNATIAEIQKQRMGVKSGADYGLTVSGDEIERNIPDYLRPYYERATGAAAKDAEKEKKGGDAPAVDKKKSLDRFF